MPPRNEPLMWKQRLGLASGRSGFVFHLVIQQKKGSILRCRPPLSLWTAFLYWQMSMGVQTLLSASLGSLYNVLIDFSLGIMDDTSASGQSEEGSTSFSPIAHNKLKMCVWVGVCRRNEVLCLSACVCECLCVHPLYVCMLPSCLRRVKMADVFFFFFFPGQRHQFHRAAENNTTGVKTNYKPHKSTSFHQN